MDTPRPGEAHRKLEAMAGTWKGEERIHPSPGDPRGGPATAFSTGRMALDGFFMITDYVEERAGRVTYRGHGVYGWDPKGQCYTMHWFDSTGGGATAPVQGRWVGNELTFERNTSMGRTRYVYQFLAPTIYHFRIESSSGGGAWKPFMEGKYMRTQGPAGPASPSMPEGAPPPRPA